MEKLKMENGNLMKIKIISIILILSFVGTSVLNVSCGMVTPQAITQPSLNKVGVFGDRFDLSIDLGMETYQDAMSSNYEILSLSQILEYKGQVVIFAHGDKEGIMLANNLFYTWEEFSAQLSSAKAGRIILASCYGSSAITEEYTGPEILAWNGYIDAVLIGYVAALYSQPKDKKIANSILSQIMTRAMALAKKEVKPAYLAFIPIDPIGGGDDGPDTQSGYVSAYRVVYSGSGIFTSRIIWFNFVEDIGDDLVELQNGFALLAEACTALLTAPVAAIIIAVLMASLVLWVISSYNRILHDYMVGVQAFKYLPEMNFLYHMGNDNYRSDGIIPIPYLAAVGIPVYFGLGALPHYTWKFLNLGY